MVSMLDCIKRVPLLLDRIIETRNDTFAALWDKYGNKLDVVDEVVLIGSGTSYTGGVTARYTAESACGLRVSLYTPAEYLRDRTVYNPHALHVFVSQTGTSILTGEALTYAKDRGFMTAAVSAAADTPIAAEADVFINMHCGMEEYPMRTIGYSTTVLTVMLLGMEWGLRRGYLNNDKYQSLLTQARAASAHIPSLIDRTMNWLEDNRRSMMRAQGIFLTGSGPLYGVALEGAVKLWETPQIISAGYELEEGLHGPTYGYNHNHCVIVLNAGGWDSQKAAALGKYMKYEKQNGYIVGVDTANEQDFAFEPAGGAFCCLEFAAIVQTLAYRLALAQGRDLFAPHDNRVMNNYFKSHSADV